jgi:hypothetical protein
MNGLADVVIHAALNGRAGIATLSQGMRDEAIAGVLLSVYSAGPALISDGYHWNAGR